MDGYRRTTIVVAGRFNPAIFHPAWFETNELLPRMEVQHATAKGTQTVITGEWAAIHFASCTLEVQQERWSLTTLRPDWASDLGPLVRSIFERLPHTPILEVGFTIEQHRPTGPISIERLTEHWLPLGNLSALEHRMG